MSATLRITLGAALLLAALAAYSNHFHNGFHFDDEHAVTSNPAITRLGNVPRFFTDATLFSIDPQGRTWRPLVSASLALDYWLGRGLNPFWFHVSSFFWFCVLLLVLWRLFERIMDAAAPHPSNPWTAWLAAACYGLHPACAETVNYIIQRGDLYDTLGCAASLLWFAARPAQRKYGWYLIPAIAADLSKAPALIYPLILLAYIVVIERGRARAALPAFLVTTAAALLTVKMTPATFDPGADSPALYRLTQPWVALHYFKTFFVPTGLAVDNGWDYVRAPLSPEALAGYGFIAAMLGLAYLASRRRQTGPVAFGILWFLLALLPTSLLPLADVANDHRMFFPFVGLALAVVWALRLLLPRLAPGPLWFRVAAALAAGVLVLEAAGVRERNRVWHTDESLWRDAAVKNPRNGRALINYATALLTLHKYGEALPYLQRAKPLRPDAANVEIDLGIAYEGLGRNDLAEPHFRDAIDLEPDSDEPYQYYARWLKRRGRSAAARQVEAALPSRVSAAH